MRNDERPDPAPAEDAEKYLDLYSLESYLFETVTRRFQSDGELGAFDFFCIIIWKANRAKSKVAKQIRSGRSEDLDPLVRELTRGIAGRQEPKEKLRYLHEEWRMRLPMASAVLSVLYPDEFTVYDVRVCEMLKAFKGLSEVSKFERRWERYLQYRDAVHRAAPGGLSLRDKDRWLWATSFADQLEADIERNFVASPGE